MSPFICGFILKPLQKSQIKINYIQISKSYSVYLQNHFRLVRISAQLFFRYLTVILLVNYPYLHLQVVTPSLRPLEHPGSRSILCTSTVPVFKRATSVTDVPPISVTDICTSTVPVFKRRHRRSTSTDACLQATSFLLYRSPILNGHRSFQAHLTVTVSTSTVSSKTLARLFLDRRHHGN